LSKTITGRIRTLTKRYEDAIHFARVAAKPQPTPPDAA
jgi:hypothetical protein